MIEIDVDHLLEFRLCQVPLEAEEAGKNRFSLQVRERLEDPAAVVAADCADRDHGSVLEGVSDNVVSRTRHCSHRDATEDARELLADLCVDGTWHASGARRTPRD